MPATALPVACEYEPGLPDRIRVYAGDSCWQIWFHNTHDLRGYLRDAVKFRGMPKAAAVEAIETYEDWWRHNNADLEFENGRDRDGVARALGLIGLCLLPWALIWGLLR